MQIVYANGVLQSLDVQTKRMVGEVMTLIEGSLTDAPTTTALKKSIKQAMWRATRNVQDDVTSMAFNTEPFYFPYALVTPRGSATMASIESSFIRRYSLPLILNRVPVLARNITKSPILHQGVSPNRSWSE